MQPSLFSQQAAERTWLQVPTVGDYNWNHKWETPGTSIVQPSLTLPPVSGIGRLQSISYRVREPVAVAVQPLLERRDGASGQALPAYGTVHQGAVRLRLTP